MSEKRPNILILMADQFRHDSMGCVGHSAVKTPNLDNLAAEGTLFTNAISNHPVCVPCRHSFITGLYTHQIGIHSNAHYWPDQPPVPTLGIRLKGIGYKTAAIGKMHWKSRLAPPEAVPDKRGFDFRASANNPASDGPLDLRPSISLTPEQQQFQSSLQERFGIGGESRAGYVGDVSPVPSHKQSDYWLAEQAVKYLNEYENDAPFCLIVSTNNPHPANVIPCDYEGMYGPDEVTLPPSVPDGFLEDDPHISRQIVNRGWGQMDEGELRLSISRYLTNCTFVDNCMGMVLNALEETGHKDNTLVVFFSDHGDMLGERNLAHTKYCMYENAMRTPFIVRWPGTGKPGIVSDTLVSHVDLMPTWLEASGLEIPDMMVGRSLKPLLEGKSAEDANWPQYAFSEIYTSPANPGEPRAQWTLRGKRYKLIQRAGSSRSALYDLREDPNEFNNLIDDPALSDIREEMRLEILTGVMERTESYPVVGIARRR